MSRGARVKKEEYDKVMRGEETDWAKVYNLTKDTIVISTEIYDANKNFVRKLSPACVIVLTDASGNFVTFSKFLGASCTNFFSQIDNFFKPDEDVRRSTKSLAFESDKLMVSSKADAEKLKDVTLSFQIEMGERGKAFGSITGKEVSEELAKLGFVVDKKNIVLDKAIKTEGLFDVELKLYKGVSCKVKVSVKAK